MAISRFCLIFTFILYSGGIVSAQKGNRGILRLIHADELKTVQIKGKQYRKAVGDVLFRRGGMDMSSDEAEFLPNLNLIKFKGNVIISGENRKLTAPQVIYKTNEDLIIATGSVVMLNKNSTLKADSVYFYRNQKVSVGMGNARINDGNIEIFADNIRYDEINQTSEAKGNALFNNLLDKTQLRGGIINYFFDLDSLVASGNPVLTKIDTTSGDTLYIRSLKMFGNTSTSVYYAQDSVKIDRLQLHAEARLAEYNAAAGIITLMKEPFVLQSNEKLTGSKILMFLDEQKVTQIYVPEDANAESIKTLFANRPAIDISAADSSIKGNLILTKEKVTDRLHGKSLRMYIEDNEVKRIVVSGMATSSYYMSEDSVLQGLNVVSGDTLILGFLNNEIRTILVLGGAVGNYSPDKYAEGSDTTVYYKSETILYDVQKKTTRLQKNSSIDYEGLKLTAHQILVDWDTSILTASGIETAAPDSIFEATGDSIMVIGLPELNQKGNKPMYGDLMEYNMRTNHGKISSGKTQMEDGYYRGDKILRLNSKIMVVSDGYFSTCDLENPHFYFKSKQMKLILNNKIIAKPVILYISGVPVFALPFGVFPNRTGRHSGLIMPSYGSTSSDGRFLRGGGFYWAGSQYHDATFIVDFFDKKGYLFRGSSKYKKRYSLNGGISGSLTPRSFNNQNRRRWDLRWNHSQTITPTLKFNSNVKLVSDESFYEDLSSNRNSRLNQQLISNVTFNKRWEGSGNGLSVNLSRNENLQSKDITEVFPKFNFRMGRKQLFKTGIGNDPRWYNSLYYTYSNGGERKRSLIHTTINDSTISVTEDTREKITHAVSVNSPQKLLKYFTFNPSLNYSEGWINEWTEPQTNPDGSFILNENGKIETRTRRSFKSRRTFSSAFQMSTKVYGNFAPNIGSLSAVRHVITPSISFRYTPDFSSDFYGYYVTGSDTLGNNLKYDLFTGTAIGGTPSKATKTLTYSINNIFQAKLNEGSENEKKLDLFTINLRGNYNFTADFRRMGPLSSSFRTKGIAGINLDISTRHNFYKWADGSITNEATIIPRLTNFTASTSFNLRGAERVEDVDVLDDAVEQYSSDDVDSRFDNLDFADLSGDAWSARISLNYTLNKTNPDNTSKTFWMRGNLNFNPTREWSVGYNYNIDLVRKIITNHSVNIRRDLHCWQFALNWTPSGPGAGYFLLINVKSAQLRDLKIEERGGKSSLFGR